MTGPIIRALLLSAGGKLLAEEAKDWLKWLSPKLIHWAAGQFSEPERRQRFEEEWLAHSNDLPGSSAKLWHSCGCAVTALRSGDALLRVFFNALFLPVIEISMPVVLATAALIVSTGLIPRGPEDVQATRLRKAGGGLVDLGLNQLELEPTDHIPPRFLAAMEFVAQTRPGRILAEVVDKSQKRWEVRAAKLGITPFWRSASNV